MLEIISNSLYYRVTKCILYSFYKNIILHLAQLWFAPYNLYSGQNLFERWSLASYNAFFTMLPPFAIGIFEKTYSQEELIKDPSIYKKCQSGDNFSVKMFWWYMFKAAYQSLTLFILTYNTMSHEVLATNGNVAGLTFIGNVVYAVTIMLSTFKAQFESTELGFVHLILIWSSPILWVFYLWTYSELAIDYIGFGDGIMSGQVSQVLISPVFWLSFCIFPAFVLIPDFIEKVCQEINRFDRNKSKLNCSTDVEGLNSPTFGNTSFNNNNSNNNKFQNNVAVDRRENSSLESESLLTDSL